ncbi:hypothetical protein ACSTKR_23470, partial [Vibrio parahaemolyticus]
MTQNEPNKEAPTKDPTILKVKGTTSPEGLSRSILHVLSDNDYVQLKSVGTPAQNIVMSAFRLAAREAESRTTGAVLVLRQSEYTATVDG